MPHVHHLKANDYTLLPWQALDSFPRDGKSVEVLDKEGNVHRARWLNDRIIVDYEKYVEITSWRPLT